VEVKNLVIEDQNSDSRVLQKSSTKSHLKEMRHH